MTLFFLFLTLLIFVASCALIVRIIFDDPKGNESLRIFLEGIKKSFQKSGFTLDNPRYPVELYQWMICEECLDCEECLERGTWDPMDIADWMKEGLPQTPEADCECEDLCRCKLVLVKLPSRDGTTNRPYK